MILGADDWAAVRLTLLLASASTALLLLLGTPVAWWLARGASRWRAPVSAVLTLPLVLPPTVLGFYLLLVLGPSGPIGRLTQALGAGALPFSFTGLVVASVIYSMPFAIQPLRSAFIALGNRPFEAAACLRARPLDSFLHVALPLVRPAFFGAAVLAFAHTLGEFGVVLMIGGSIPGQTRVLSIQIYDHVESLEYAQAHVLAGGLLVISFFALLLLYRFDTLRRMF